MGYTDLLHCLVRNLRVGGGGRVTNRVSTHRVGWFTSYSNRDGANMADRLPIPSEALDALKNATAELCAKRDELLAEENRHKQQAMFAATEAAIIAATVRSVHFLAIRQLQQKYYDLPVFIEYEMVTYKNGYADKNRYKMKCFWTKPTGASEWDGTQAMYEVWRKIRKTRVFGRMDDDELEVLFPVPGEKELPKLARPCKNGYGSD